MLVVDDNEAAAVGMRKLLAHQGHDARAVHTGHDAILHVRSFRPDVVLLDIGLPDITGLDVASRLKEEYGPRTPHLIALTGYGQEDDREKALKSGFDRHMTKPVSISEVVEIISQM